ncbi:hypothetical protein [Leptolyngbya sp. FACHB-261]|uniref:hypothetical protein n=1 Tax=Leptolyngbya sp. FACHB-261 TaxID=2692806 RepID=UPI001682BC72|nr:hypothetical protein [Leptolyngbya sp. FACHB-261]MBD2100765.1 hypothetical protein [Leptolyngbya sp. FACHB-261]
MFEIEWAKSVPIATNESTLAKPKDVINEVSEQKFNLKFASLKSVAGLNTLAFRLAVQVIGLPVISSERQTVLQSCLAYPIISD